MFPFWSLSAMDAVSGSSRCFSSLGVMEAMAACRVSATAEKSCSTSADFERRFTTLVSPLPIIASRRPNILYRSWQVAAEGPQSSSILDRTWGSAALSVCVWAEWAPSPPPDSPASRLATLVLPWPAAWLPYTLVPSSGTAPATLLLIWPPPNFWDILASHSGMVPPRRPLGTATTPAMRGRRRRHVLVQQAMLQQDCGAELVR
mmetsp:Transcript_70777/g.199855  ORF Transcript_70777/g.199855 Transcript_70777/m.199855 type:complete len:204 (-) Transcript_70777:26-637(-)